MAENPLLPDAELRRLHTLLQSAQKLDRTAARQAAKATTGRRRSAPSQGREALLAGTLLQLRPGDLLTNTPQDAVAPAVLKAATSNHDASVHSVTLPSTGQHLMLAAAMAAALKASGRDGVVLAHTQTNTPDALWPEALAWAQRDLLPLVVACADPSGPNAFLPDRKASPGNFTWSSLAKTTKTLGLPVLSVDGEDAVAVYRVTQESLLRARAGGGPALLWAVLPAPKITSRPAAANPLARLKRYLRTRRIAL